jgi:Flp pilus assembly protein TadD
MGRTSLARDDGLVYIQLGPSGVIQLEGGRSLELPDIPFPVRRSDLEAYEGSGELPLEVLVEGTLAALVSQEDPAIAEDYRRFLFSVEPNVDQLLVAQGLTMAREDRVEEAVARFQSLVHLCPDHAQGWMNLGLCTLDLARRWPHQRDRFQREALRAFRKAVEVDDLLAPAHFYLGCLHRDRGQTSAAREAWRQCLRVRPGDDEVASSARQLLQQFEERQDLDLTFEQGCLAIFAGEPEEAEVLLKRVVDFFLGLAYRLQGDYLRASAALEHVVEQRPQEAEAWAELGLCELEQGRLDEAEAALERARGMLPENARIVGNLGLVMLRRGRAEEARELFRAAQAMDPLDPAPAEYLQLVDDCPDVSEDFDALPAPA